MRGSARRLTPADAAPAAEVLAEAFDGYPWTSWTVAADRHRARLTELFRVTLAEVGIPYGEAWAVTGDDDRIEAVAVWMHPDREVPPQTWASLASRQKELAGDRWEASQAAERAGAALSASEPAFALATVGVRASRRRSGAGSAVLRPVLEEADRQGRACVLETSAAANLAFYRRLGFEVTGEVDVPGSGPHVWAMRRPPRRPGPGHGDGG